MAKSDKNNQTQSRYFFVAVCFGLIVIAIIAKAGHTSLVDGEGWRIKGDAQIKPDITEPAPRGNIYSHDGQLMATTEYKYRLYIDFWADGLKGDTLKKYIGPLSIELAKMFPDKTAAQHRSHIMAGWNIREKEDAQLKRGKKVRKSRRYKLFADDRQINHLELKEIKTMPFLRQNKYKSGLIIEDFKLRTKPFGTLASRTIGDVFGNFENNGKIGKNGLELEYDSLLRGVPGISTLRRVNGRSMKVVDVDPIPGKDIISTIDTYIQDITEKALLDKLKAIDAESGTAVVMEVETGEIKAITNMGRIREGVWDETKNHAVADEIEPGSTFKVASMMVALEDGVITPNDTIFAENGRFKHPGGDITDHNEERGGYQRISASQTIRYSSNIGVAKIILQGYGNNYQKYVDGLHRMGLNEVLDLEIPGSGKSYINTPKTERDLLGMSYGYVTKIPPIYTLTFFNAIANKGKMVKPIFVKEIRDQEKTIEQKKTKVIKNKICSDNTLKQIQAMLYDVVNQTDGTGKPAHSDFVEISGKTGTARIYEGKTGFTGGHQVSFCGYFPSDKPLYSVIVVIRRPKNGIPSGGSMCGTVCKTIAEGVTAKVITQKPEDYPSDSLIPLLPKVKYGMFPETKYIMEKLDISYTDKNLNGNWFVTETKDDKVVLKDRKIIENQVPNVIGMGAKDAVYLLGNAGLKVNLTGKGTVVSQSLTAGTKVVKGQTIAIALK